MLLFHKRVPLDLKIFSKQAKLSESWLTFKDELHLRNILYFSYTQAQMSFTNPTVSHLYFQSPSIIYSIKLRKLYTYTYIYIHDCLIHLFIEQIFSKFLIFTHSVNILEQPFCYSNTRCCGYNNEQNKFPALMVLKF